MSSKHIRSYDVKYISPEVLDIQEKMLLMIFLSMRNLRVIRLSVGSLAKESSISIASVKRKLKQLESKGFIKRLKKGVKNVTVTEIVESKIEEEIRSNRPEVFDRFIKSRLSV